MLVYIREEQWEDGAGELSSLRGEPFMGGQSEWVWVWSPL